MQHFCQLRPDLTGFSVHGFLPAQYEIKFSNTVVGSAAQRQRCYIAVRSGQTPVTQVIERIRALHSRFPQAVRRRGRPHCEAGNASSRRITELQRRIQRGFIRRIEHILRQIPFDTELSVQRYAKICRNLFE